MLKRTVVNNAPIKPSQVLLGERVVSFALMIFLPKATPQKYAAISFVIIIAAGNTTLCAFSCLSYPNKKNHEPKYAVLEVTNKRGALENDNKKRKLITRISVARFVCYY